MRNRKDLSDMRALHTNVFWSLTRVARGICDSVMKGKIYHYREDIKYCKLDIMACLIAQWWFREDNLNFSDPRCLAPIYLFINWFINISSITSWQQFNLLLFFPFLLPIHLSPLDLRFPSEKAGLQRYQSHIAEQVTIRLIIYPHFKDEQQSPVGGKGFHKQVIESKTLPTPAARSPTRTTSYTTIACMQRR